MYFRKWLCVAMALMIACMAPAGALAAAKAAIKLPAKLGIIYVDQEVQLKAKTRGVKAESLKYEPSAQGVVEISATGKVKGVAQGKVSVTVSGDGASAKCTLLVVPKTVSVTVGDKVKLPTASKVKFAVKNAKIAKVAKDGTVKGLKAGKTKLVMAYGKLKRTIAVEVMAANTDGESRAANTDGESRAAQLDAAAQTEQIVLVEYKSGSKATLSVHEKKDGKWVQLFETPACVGKNGIDKTREGDKRTPTGTFNLTTPFGIKADPGAQMPYTKVTKYHYWCGSSDSEYYNKLVTSTETGRKWTKSDEHLIDYKGYYNYALFIDYNAAGEAGKGSCIFLHCKGSKSYTAGCVAVSEASMKKIVKWAKSGAKIVIRQAD